MGDEIMKEQITLAQFQAWLDYSLPNEKLCYFEGHLAFDREFLHNGEWRPTEPLNTLAKLVYDAYQWGQIELVQKRSGPMKCRYYAVKRRYARRAAR